MFPDSSMDSSTRRRHMSDVTTLTSLTSLGAPHRLGLEDGHITPAIKQELRLSIMAKRHARGEGEISADVRHPVALELTPAELEKKERRREQNRRAAQRCRRKKRMSQMNILQNYESIVVRNQQLQEEVRRLRQDQADLQATLKAHLSTCTCAVSSAAGRVPRIKLEPREGSPDLAEGSPNPPSSSLSGPATPFARGQHGAIASRLQACDVTRRNYDHAHARTGQQMWSGSETKHSHSYQQQQQQQQYREDTCSNFLQVQDNNNNNLLPAQRPHLADLYLGEDSGHGSQHASPATAVSPGLPDSAGFFSTDVTSASRVLAAHPPDVTRTRRSLLLELTFPGAGLPETGVITSPSSDGRGSLSSDSDVSMGSVHTPDVSPGVGRGEVAAAEGGMEEDLLSQLTTSELLLLEDVFTQAGGDGQDGFLQNLVPDT
ncbi:activating transcription factor 3-like isoform X1 [Pomacea canaliculata]|uniref:activating transcription factor 3-like isoform X1 n=2 Tax=Pomacea canaliculata TaxID=400727 RepID=UPI000D72D126|nr:activating transcription factor 3-like isoform X1 [Pomacea canaliculata]